MMDLYRATREDLIRLVVEQRTVIAALEQRCADQARQLADLQATVAELTKLIGCLRAEQGDGPPGRGGAKGMPGLKTTQVAAAERGPRRQRSGGYGRTRMEATGRQVHALRACPGCGAPLAGGTIKRTREVIDLLPPQVVVTEHLYVERRCPDCGRRCVPPPELAGVVVGQGRFGVGLASLITVLREEARLPFAMLQQVVQTLTGVSVSEGAVVDIVQRVAQRAEPVVEAMTAAIRASPVVHADETGWREGGRNGYVWTFSTPQQRLFVRGSRAREMLTTTLGQDFAGVLVSDFYSAYTGYEGMHQYCWAHLLRDLEALVTEQPTDATVRGWAGAVQATFQQALTGATGTLADRRRVRASVERDLRQLCEPWGRTSAPQSGLCQRILRHLDGLLIFVTEPAVPPTNNAAERSLRHLVVSRKISGGTRSPRGTATKMNLASLFGTWRMQGINSYAACCQLLCSPQI